MRQLRPAFYLFLTFIFLIVPFKSFAKSDTSNEHLMNATILGAIASFGFACYEGKAPCSLNPGINTEKLTLSADAGADDSVQQLRLALGADWTETLYQGKQFKIDGRWEINTNFWESTKSNPRNKNGWILGLTPVFQYSWIQSHFSPYLELGAGPQYLSDIVIENEYKSTQFQFGSIFGLGISTKKLELGYRYLHISNANIEIPNPGTDFHNFHLGYKF